MEFQYLNDFTLFINILQLFQFSKSDIIFTVHISKVYYYVPTTNNIFILLLLIS